MEGRITPTLFTPTVGESIPRLCYHCDALSPVDKSAAPCCCRCLLLTQCNAFQWGGTSPKIVLSPGEGWSGPIPNMGVPWAYLSPQPKRSVEPFWQDSRSCNNRPYLYTPCMWRGLVISTGSPGLSQTEGRSTCLSSLLMQMTVCWRVAEAGYGGHVSAASWEASVSHQPTGDYYAACWQRCSTDFSGLAIVAWLFFLFIIIFFDPRTQFPGNEKITLCNTKSTKMKLLFLLLFFTPVLNSRGKKKLRYAI